MPGKNDREKTERIRLAHCLYRVIARKVSASLNARRHPGGVPITEVGVRRCCKAKSSSAPAISPAIDGSLVRQGKNFTTYGEIAETLWHRTLRWKSPRLNHFRGCSISYPKGGDPP